MNEAEFLFTEALGCDKASLYLNRDKYLESEKFFFISEVFKRRLKGEPLQYILGNAEFMGLSLKVNKDVLIPRPETEILVETALSYIGTPNKPIVRVSPKVLDLGTGSGCIAISLAKHLAHLDIHASDISGAALDVARENAALNGLKINFIQSDLFAGLQYKGYDFIISNPPYIASGEINKLQAEVRSQPRLALDAGYDGLSFYRRIVIQAQDYLKPAGFLIMEIGFGQRKAVEGIFKRSASLCIKRVVKDYNNIDRVIVAQKGR